MHNETVRNPVMAGERSLVVIAVVACVLLLMAPRATHAIHLLFSAALLLSVWTARDELSPRPLSALAIALLSFGFYISLNAAWSVDPLEAYVKVGYYWFLSITVYLSVLGLASLEHPFLRRLVEGLLAGLLLAGLILAVEVLFDQPLRRGLYNAVPALRGPVKNLEIMQGQVQAIGLQTLNRSVAILCFLLWPAILMLSGFSRLGRYRLPAALAVLLVSALVVFSSEHETSMLALVASIVAFAGLMLAPSLMRALILAGWLVASLLIVPIAATAYGAGLFKAGWIPETGRNRIILWAVTANEVRKAPYLGVGVGSTKELDEQAAPKAQKPADHTYPLRTGRHAHNVFMQTWYELGAAGALILSAIGVCAWLVLGRLEPNLQPYAFASFVCAAVIGAFSWGMWQTWFMAAYAIWALALALAIEWARRGDDEPA